MKRTLIMAFAMLASSSFAQLYSNGPMVTHAGAGAGGADVSMASLVPNSGGSNVTGTIWRADEFVVSGGGWNVNSINTYAYDTGNGAAPRFGAGTMEIRQGTLAGTILATANLTWATSGINRIFNGVGNLQNTDRVVWRLTANFGNVALSDGMHFMVFNLSNTAAANNWVPYVMDPNSANPNDPITRIGNSQVSTNSGVAWANGTVTTGGWNNTPEIPFEVYGQAVPEPATMTILGLGALAAWRRRNKK